MSETKHIRARAIRRTLQVQTPRTPRADVPRSRRGFTLAELLTVVAILGIMAAIAIVSISAIQRNAQQAELDGTAKELFIAAQNHLSTADAQGFLARKTDKGVEVPDEDGVYYYAVNGATDARLNDQTNASAVSVLYQMLPYGSIDETVRTGGTYIIKYDYDNAQVLAVFYARSSYSSLFAANTDGFAFTGADYARLFPAYEGDEHKQVRQSYDSASGLTVMVGYYGGDGIDLEKGERLAKPRIKVENAERLKATVTNPNTGAKFSDMDLTMKLIVHGQTSGKNKAITLINRGASNAAEYAYVKAVGTSGNVFEVYLDDITARNGHFANIFGADGFIPGEDVRIQAVISSTTKLTNVGQSAKVRRNSLFASVYSDKSASVGAASTDVASTGTGLATASAGVRTARISNIRHLENLSYNVSGYDPTGSLSASMSVSALAVAAVSDPLVPGTTTSIGSRWADFAAQRAVQTTDLSWASFCEKIEPTSPASVQVYQRTTRSDDVEVGSFMPVFPEYALTYDGRDHRVADVVVSRPMGNGGLFDTLAEGSSVADLELVDFKVSAQAGDAGALAGSVTGTDISGVAAYNEALDDTDLEISAGLSAGGLVGSMTGGSIDRSAAAVYVRTSGAYAGGLAGWVGGSVAVTGSYAGGHTSGGAYDTSTSAGVAGRMNVISSDNAGGLVGNAASGSLSIASSYSTASAAAPIAGGLVGYANGGDSASNCYATGKVSGSTVGAVVGMSEGASLSGCRYLEIVNEGVGAVGSGSGSAVAADASVGAYAAFATGGADAYPYDGRLMQLYQGTYQYPTAAQLLGTAAGGSTPAHVGAHYGDWPAIETLVVNVPG